MKFGFQDHGGEEMNKSELVAAIAESAKLSKAVAERALNGFLGGVEKALAKGESVTLVKFGTFSVIKRAGRTGRNPQTGKPLQIPARKSVKFKTGKGLAGTVR
jgi:DNA-binding protein HU-beta